MREPGPALRAAGHPQLALIAGPSFFMWTVIAIHDPTRACPSSRAWASIVRPSAARPARGIRPRATIARSAVATSERVRRP